MARIHDAIRDAATRTSNFTKTHTPKPTHSSYASIPGFERSGQYVARDDVMLELCYTDECGILIPVNRLERIA